MYGLLKEVIKKMGSMWKALFSSTKKDGEGQSIFKQLEDFFWEAEQKLRGNVLGLSSKMWEYVDEKVKCDGGCGLELMKAAGWTYIERDYEMTSEDGKLEVKTNFQKLYCPKCARKLGKGIKELEVSEG
jgi:hypothetical protein